MDDLPGTYGELGWQLSGTPTGRRLAKIESSPIRTLQSAMGYNRNIPLKSSLVQPPLGIGLTNMRRTRKTSTPTATHPAKQPPRKNDVVAIQWTQVTAGVGFAVQQGSYME
jgi:hypothetical protein